jgi:hypothetical protein
MASVAGTSEATDRAGTGATRVVLACSASTLLGLFFLARFISATARPINGGPRMTLFDDAMITMTYGTAAIWRVHNGFVTPCTRSAPGNHTHSPVSASVWAMSLWRRSEVALHVNDEHELVLDSIALTNVTTAEAQIATVWAGIPGYYSDRSMIDLLGKSDRHVANVAPNGALLPGHNKWDYDYSIGQLHPDVVLDLWGPADEAERTLRSNGYVQRCYEVADRGRVRAAYFKSDSPAVIWTNLVSCPF